jgi:hypothetical protein
MCDNHTSKDCQDLLYHNDTVNLFNHPRVIRAAFRAKKEAELGKHAAQSGMDLKAYAEASGKAYKSLYNKVTSYRVSSVSHVGNADAQDNWRNLAEIHAAPNWLWKALVAEMLEQSWYLDTDTAWPEPSKS